MAKFFKWFDYMSWYPLGRPIGTTIYPGMQMTSVAIWRTLNATGLPALAMSLNDVCCYVPAWFGVSATLFTGMIAAEAANSINAGVFAGAVMAVVPAHLMRSVGGGYDNESIALTAMTLTFYLWIRSLRNERAWPIGALTGLAYVYMVAAWGGYIFVLNMIGVHAAVLVAIGRYSSSLHRAYSLFYVIGTYGAMCVPVVGWAPLKSLEQLGPFGVFAFLQVVEVADVVVRARKLPAREAFKTRAYVFGGAALLAALVLAALVPTGYFGPLSSRVRGLFVKHTRTGNPLVDSVAEHQPASDQAYYQYLQLWCVYLAPLGWAGMLIHAVLAQLAPAFGSEPFADARVAGKTFLVLYGVVGYYFCNKMVRLIILLGPVASALSGASAGAIFDWAIAQFGWLPSLIDADADEPAAERKAAAKPAALSAGKDKGKPKVVGGKKSGSGALAGLHRAYASTPARTVRVLVAVVLLWLELTHYRTFYHVCQSMADGMSQPSIMFRANLRDGTPVMIDDYREVRASARARRACPPSRAPCGAPCVRAADCARAQLGSTHASLRARLRRAFRDLNRRCRLAPRCRVVLRPTGGCATTHPPTRASWRGGTMVRARAHEHACAQACSRGMQGKDGGVCCRISARLPASS
jgi:dolichyl-diphosphooligosaccharide--protein glycosyltransferase